MYRCAQGLAVPSGAQGCPRGLAVPLGVHGGWQYCWVCMGVHGCAQGLVVPSGMHGCTWVCTRAGGAIGHAQACTSVHRGWRCHRAHTGVHSVHWALGLVVLMGVHWCAWVYMGAGGTIRCAQVYTDVHRDWWCRWACTSVHGCAPGLVVPSGVHSAHGVAVSQGCADPVRDL